MNIINFLQSFQTDWLTSFFKFITFFGNEEFYILVLPLFFWFWDKDKALKLFFIILPTLLFNFYLKEIFHTARPVGVALIEQAGYAFPSGHAQGSVTLWLMLALLVRKKWMTVLAILMIILVPLSRLYLGVHWPIDVLGGLVIGAFITWVYLSYLFESFKKYLSERTKLKRAIYLTVLVAFFMFLFAAHDAVIVLAVVWGFGIVIIYTDVINTTLRDGLAWKLLTFVVGIVVIILIWKGLKVILPYNQFGWFVRYAALGIWIAYLPLLMRKRSK